MKLDLHDVSIKDLIALITIIAGFFLIWSGKDGVVGTALTLVIAFYFSRFRKENGKK